MDDFLGTSIQYSEQQILLLEQQHADDLQKTVEELIELWTDSEYEDSTESEIEPEPEPESMDENEIEIQENIPICTEDQLSLELWTDSNMNISPRTSTHPISDSDLIFFNHIIEYLLNKTCICGIKPFMILCVLIIALPHIIYDQQNNNNNPSYNNPSYNNVSYNNQCGYHYYHINTSPYYSTSTYWFYDTSSHQNKKLLNEEEDERDEYYDTKTHNNSQCKTNNEFNGFGEYHVMYKYL